MIMMLLDVQSVGHSCARTDNRPFYSREPERYYLYYPVHTNEFSLSWKTHRSLRVHTTVLKRNMMCMHFRFDPLSRAF